ncbi:MAG: diacylglycerol kinase family protein, partial [Myxococcota bacterium]|nr:diacylglycerol kinase family protein [Myxococcota bacterium]
MTIGEPATRERDEGQGDRPGPPVWLVHNPRSRAGAKNGERLRAVAEESGGEIAWRAPETLEALAAVVAEATAAGAEILAIHGGDGTLHRVLSALIAHLGGGKPGPHLRDLPVPQIMILRAGTVNIVAGNIGAPADGANRLRKLLEARAAGRAPQTRDLALTVVNGQHAGFIFGTGAIPRMMDAYYEGGDASVWKSAKVIGQGVVSTLVGGAFANHLFHRDPYTVTVDGEVWPGDGWGAVCTGTVPKMALGFAPFYSLRDQTGHLHVLAIRC